MTPVAAATDTVRIFISHKAEDAEAAREIGKQFIAYGQGRLRVFRSEEVPTGAKWRPALFEELARADRLILLYTDPHQEWNWCLYESGFFDGKQFPDSTKRLVVLHDESVVPPDPLTHFQTVRVSRSQRDPL